MKTCYPNKDYLPITDSTADSAPELRKPPRPPPTSVPGPGITRKQRLSKDIFPNIPDPYFRDTCHECGVTSAISTEFVLSRIKSKKSVFCPNGHTGKMDKEYVVSRLDKVSIPWDQFTQLNCGNCGISFQLEKGLHKDRKENGKSFTCPNGCERAFLKPEKPLISKTEADIDYEKLICYHNALGVIAALTPELFQNKKLLKRAILIARNALDLEKFRKTEE
jgi:hypothetical protein